ncbi:protein kinase domain-containing protein [Ditylenchus destructor]|nr:protein kinase domain-containing protein [Ditylenchus destructor]
MNALHIDVIPSSSHQAIDVPEKKGYEDVSYNEILFPNFEHRRRLGRGSYGTVIQCHFRGRLAAAKLVEADNVDHRHIHNEARLLHEFDHENIIRLYAAFHGEQMGLILELMEGGSLNELLHQKKHVHYEACHALGWAIQVTSALSYLHERGFVHRDLKPSNMLLTRDYITLKLCDFGTAAELRTSMTNNRGSAAWMAPEVFRGKRYDQKCDIFSFGILFWEIITREQPFNDWNPNPYTILWQVSEGRRPHKIKICPAPIMELIERCWSDNPKERPYIAEVNSIVEFLCEIYPNRYLPLIDRSTGQQAVAERPADYYGAHAFQPQNGPRLQSGRPPVPPPPNHMGHRRGNSHDFRYTNPNQLYAAPATSCHSATDMTNLTYTPNYTNPHQIPPHMSNPPYNFQMSSPLPNARPYNPCMNHVGMHPPPIPPPPILSTQLSRQSNSSDSNSLMAIASTAPLYTSSSSDSGVRRASEPPGSDNDSAYGSNSDKRKKSHGIGKLLKSFEKKVGL